MDGELDYSRLDNLGAAEYNKNDLPKNKFNWGRRLM